MKENHLKIILLLLIAVIIIQAYYLYDVNRSKNLEGVFLVRTPLVFSTIGSMNDFFNENKNPFIEMERLQHRMENNFKNIENYFQAIPSFNKFTSEFYRIPRFDMKEQKGKYIITMEIPGSLADAIESKIENGKLSINAKILQEKDDNTTSYYRHERHASSYRHEVDLPTDADANSLQKEYKDGLLIISINKKIP